MVAAETITGYATGDASALDATSEVTVVIECNCAIEVEAIATAGVFNGEENAEEGAELAVGETISVTATNAEDIGWDTTALGVTAGTTFELGKASINK